MNAITLKNISKYYGQQRVIESLDLEVSSNEFLSLLGPSGCGKTTLIRMIAGLENPSDGDIFIGEEKVFSSASSVSVPPEKRNIGMVFQSYALWPHMTVFENVAFPLRCRKISKPEVQSRCLEILNQVKLSGLDKRRPNELSGGQQQRAALARALVAHPRVLLLDEPLSNLDTNLREEMCELIGALKKTHPITMIYVTHDQNEAFKLSDRIAVMNQGVIHQLDTWDNLKNNPKSDFVKSFIRFQ